MSAKNKKGGGRAGGRSGNPTGPQSGTPGPKRPYSTIDLKATDITPKSSDADKGKDQAKSQITPPEFGSTARPQSGKTGSSSATSSSSTTGGGGSATGGSGTSSSAGPAPASSSANKSSVPLSSQTAAKSKPDTSKPTGASKSATGAKAPPPPPAQPQAPAKQKSSGGFLSHMSAAIVGAVLTLFGAKYADQYIQIPGLPVSGGSTGTASTAISPELSSRLSARLTKLEQAVTTGAGASSAANSPDIAALTDGLAAAQARLSKLEALGSAITDLQMSQVKLQDETAALRKNGAETGDSAALTGRLAQLEQTLAALGAAATKDPDNAGRIPQLAAISGRLNDLETALKTRITVLRQDLVEEIDKRSANMNEASQSAKSGTQRLDRDVAALRTSTAKLDQRLVDMDAGSKQMRERLRVVQEATGNLKVALKTLHGDLAAKLKQTAKPADVSAAIAPIAKQISALEQNLQSVVQSESARKSNAKRIVLALELGNLKRALDRGRDFAPELAQVKRVAGDTLDLSALEAHSGSTVPTLAVLQKNFGALSYKMIDAITMKENATVMDRLLNGAKSMVRVRRVNHSRDDNSAEAIVGRMDSALKDGHLGAVLSEAKKLPDKAKATAADWLANVMARQSVDQALGQIEAKLKSSLGGTTSDERG